MNKCIPYRATELTDLLFNCKTFELTIIQTAADGEETSVYVDLSCILDGKNPVVDVRAECEDKTLVFEFEDGRLLPIDMACLDTYVTWTDNLNGSIKLISADGDSSIDVMGSCERIPIIFDVPDTHNIVMCDNEGGTVKAPIRNVIEAIELDYTQFEDGHGTSIAGEGTLVNPYRIDLNVCELEEREYDQSATVAACVDYAPEGDPPAEGESVKLPVIKAGNGVIIQNTGRLDVSFCDKPEIPYDSEASLLVCSGTATRRMPNLKAGDNVTITDDGTVNVGIASQVPTGTITMYGGTVAPEGYLMCKGAEVSRVDYAPLFAIIGTAFGPGDESSTFDLPNMTDRVVAGVTNIVGATGGKNTHNASDIPNHNHTMNSKGSHTHTVNNGGAHTHPMATSSYLNDEGTDRVVDSQKDNPSIVNTGSAGSHKHTLVSNGNHSHTINNSLGSGSTGDNRQATIYLNFIIKY